MITEVHTTPPIGSPGSCADTGMVDPVSATLEDDIAPGHFAIQGSADKTAAAVGASDDLLLGLVMKQEHIASDRVTDDGEYKAGTVVGIKKTGRSHVYVKGNFSPALPVYVRYVANEDEAVGSLSSSADPGENRLVPASAIQFASTGADDIAIVEIHIHDDAIDPDET